MSLCHDCAYVRIDEKTWHTRCYSPQLVKLRLGGIIVAFERDATIEDGRSHDDGTGKCGEIALNFRHKDRL